jgi:hypothetical protein
VASTPRPTRKRNFVAVSEGLAKLIRSGPPLRGHCVGATPPPYQTAADTTLCCLRGRPARTCASRVGAGRFDLRTALGQEVAVPLFDAVLGGVKAREPEWFNEDEQLKEGMVAVLDSKDGAVADAIRKWARERSPTEKAPLPSFPQFPIFRVVRVGLEGRQLESREGRQTQADRQSRNQRQRQISNPSHILSPASVVSCFLNCLLPLFSFSPCASYCASRCSHPLPCPPL